MNRFVMWVISVFILCLLVGSVYFLIFYKKSVDEDKVIYNDKTVTVDNTISPENTTQGVFLEVNRIHKKGIENEFIKIGNSWKIKPTFHFEAIVDNAIWIGNDINDWDTGFIGWESLKDVEDEQETATVEFKIFETKKKLFGTEKLEMESFSVIYNFKTGRWSGDDSFNDSDGYGHINGKNYEVWFSLNQFDVDNDGIPFWTENNILGT
ncbi:MAG: hypothetical protein MUO82_07335, partial [Candidatus Thermoplasmatota archaeon]|nr:hypothetical protein [Candidatus Thermoplasmatota archaeon]